MVIPVHSIRVAAFTRAGRGKSSKQIFCKTAEDGKIRKTFKSALARRGIS